MTFSPSRGDADAYRDGEDCRSVSKDTEYMFLGLAPAFLRRQETCRGNREDARDARAAPMPARPAGWFEEPLHAGRFAGSIQEQEEGENVEEKDTEMKHEEKKATAECRVVVLRLTRRARTPEVQRLLSESPMLANQRARVVNANCEVRAALNCLAKIYVPYADKLIEELKEAGVELQDHHIVCWESDIHCVQSALRELPCSKRPLLAQVYPASVRSCAEKYAIVHLESASRHGAALDRRH